MNSVPKFAVILIILIFFGNTTSTTFAQLSLPQIFSNGMVLQRKHVIPIWGKASPKSEISVSLMEIFRSTNADGEGNWHVVLPAMEAGGPYVMTVSADSQKITLTDVYIGDVWLASGQSNMVFSLCDSEGGAIECATANDQKIRQFKVQKELSNNLSDELPSGSVWNPAIPRYVWEFSAVGYYLAYYLRKDLDIPIGIINTSYSGSRIEAWMSYSMLGYKELDTKMVGSERQHQPSVAFNKMVNPLIKFPIKGIIWYQGESNAYNIADAQAYSNLFKTMIKGWRSLWADGDIPFIWVQLPGYNKVYNEPQTLNIWPYLRTSQSSALSLPNTGEAIAIDVGSIDVHPKKKREIGYRLSLIARKIAYNENIMCSSPRYVHNFLRDDGKIVIDFENIGEGLKVKDTKDNHVSGFAVADRDNDLVWANAVIENNKVIVWSDEISNPTIVRYAWENNPATANLYNAQGLPAAPFLAKVNPGVEIKYFTLGNESHYVGETVTLSWHVNGATNVTLNGVQVDTASTIRIKLERTNNFVLIAESKYNISDKDTALITFVVPNSKLFLEQNFPNPCNPKTNITYSLPEDGKVQIKIFDVLGQEVATLLNGFMEAGKHSIDWNGNNSASGIYFYGLSFKGQTIYKKMLLIK